MGDDALQESNSPTEASPAIAYGGLSTHSFARSLIAAVSAKKVPAEHEA